MGRTNQWYMRYYCVYTLCLNVKCDVSTRKQLIEVRVGIPYRYIGATVYNVQWSVIVYFFVFFFYYTPSQQEHSQPPQDVYLRRPFVGYTRML